MGHAEGSRRDDHRTLTATEPGRLDAVLAAAFEDLSRSRIQRLIESGQALVNGNAVRKGTVLSPGDVVELTIPVTPHEPLASGLNPSILYEDPDLAVINKPAGVAVHGAPGDRSPSIAGWWLERLGEAASAFDVERPGVVHRLDKDTSGVLVLAKTPVAQAKLSAAFEARTTRKSYLAVVEGVPERPRAVIEAPIARHPGDRTRMAIVTRGRAARTEYELLYQDGRRSLLEVHPETGRTHQIRVHLAAINVPVVDDAVYGKREPGGRQLLHAYQLTVPLPSGGTLTVTAPIPPDFDRAVRQLGAATLAIRYAQSTPPIVTSES